MNEKRLHCGFSMPVLGMGTWGMGGYLERDAANDDDADIAALSAGLDAGFTHIDTAEIYGGGHAEEIAGQAISGRKRQYLFITSKVWTKHLDYDGVIRAAEGSLERLGTDYLDLYLIHHVREDVPLRDTVRALDRLKSEGIIRNLGVSNFGLSRLKEAQAHSGYKIVANQVHYNLVFREPELELLQYCQEHDVMLIAWRPVQAKEILQSNCKLLKQLCQKYKKTPSQIAINWLAHQTNVVTIVTMRSLRHIQENLDATRFTMEDCDIEFLRKEFPGQRMVSDAVPLK